MSSPVDDGGRNSPGDGRFPGFMPPTSDETHQQPQWPPPTLESSQPPRRRRVGTAVVVAVVVLALMVVGGVVLGQRALTNRAAVAAVEYEIGAIGVVTLGSAERIEAAQEAYDDLPTELQDRVGNRTQLDAATDEFQALERAEASRKAALEAVAGVQEMVDWALRSSNCYTVDAAVARVEGLAPEHRELINGVSDVLEKGRRCDIASQNAVAEAEEERRATERRRNAIRLEGGWWSGPEAGERGCEYFITPEFTNLTDLTINYAYFTVQFYNRLDDVETDVDGESEHVLRIVGPIEPGHRYSEDAYGYVIELGCGVVETLDVLRASLEYADGSRDEIDRGLMRCAKSWNDNCEG